MTKNSFFIFKSRAFGRALVSIIYLTITSTFLAYSATVYVCPEDFPLAPNDTQAIQMAIDDASVNGKVVLLKPHKTYIIESTLDGKGVSIMGNNAIFKHKSAINNIRMLQYTDDNIFFIRDLRFNGNQFNIDITANRHIVWIENCRNVLLQNCRLFNVGTHVMRFQNTNRVIVDGCNFNLIGTVSVKPVDNVDAIFITNTVNQYHNNFKITNCSFQNITNRLKDADGIQTSMVNTNGDELSDIIVSNNYFHNIERRCMKFQSGSSLVVEGNIANDCRVFIGHARQYPGQHAMVANNIITDTFMFYELGNGVPGNIPAETFNNIVIEGNNFSNGTHFVFNSSAGTMNNVTVANNVLTGHKGLILRGGGFDISFMNNNVEYVSQIFAYSVLLTSGGRIRIEGNTFRSTFQDLRVVHIWPLDNSGNPIQYNIVRHNLFATDHNGSTSLLIHPDTYTEPTNILLID